MTHRFDYVQQDKRAPIRVLYIPSGEASPHFKSFINTSKSPVLEYYDLRYPHTPDGQFIVRYHLISLVSHKGDLNLDPGGDEEWQVSSERQQKILKWALEIK